MALGTDVLTWRRLRVLLSYLPRESAFVRAVGGEQVRWGDVEYLLASVVDALHVANWQQALVHFKGKPQPPAPLPRPGMTAPGATKIGSGAKSKGEMRRLLERWRKGGGG